MWKSHPFAALAHFTPADATPHRDRESQNGQYAAVGNLNTIIGISM